MYKAEIIKITKNLFCYFLKNIPNPGVLINFTLIFLYNICFTHNFLNHFLALYSLTPEIFNLLTIIKKPAVQEG